LVGPAIPDADRSRAVGARRDVALEVEVLDRMVLDVDREPVLAWAVRQRVGDGERHQHPVALEPQVPVKPARVMLVDHETLAAAAARGLGAPARLRGALIALAAIWPEPIAHIADPAKPHDLSSRRAMLSGRA